MCTVEPSMKATIGEGNFGLYREVSLSHFGLYRGVSLSQGNIRTKKAINKVTMWPF